MHQISTRTALEPYLPQFFAYCPTMDLVATVTRKGGVDVWRLNGQRVFGANFAKDEDDDDFGEQAERDELQDEGGNVKAIAWRRDGQILAVACSDGTLSLINSFTGKIANRISTYTQKAPSPPPLQPQTSRRSSKPPTESHGPLSVSALSWTTHFAYPSPDVVRSRLPTQDSTYGDVSLDQILSLRADVDKLLQLQVDLPRELSNIDVETSLPKLATLPPTGVGVDDDVFSSRGSVDVIFHGGGGNSGSGGQGGVDTLLVGLDEGGRCEVHLRIFDSFEVGTVDLVGVLPVQAAGGASRVLKIESHPFLSTVFLVVEQRPAGVATPTKGNSSLHLLSLDMSFIPQTGRNLPLVARKATQLGNLLRYISQVHTQLVAEVKAAFDLPSKFLRNVNESLAEADENADFVYAAHHLAVTGDYDPKLKEWLVDEVGDRGLKRWEKAVGDCLEVVRRMTSECLLPALERCLVVLSRLDGLARFPPTSSRLGLDEKSVRRVRETIDTMGILAEDLLLDVGAEMREFAAFIKWLKWECEVGALEEGSERAEELRESWTGEMELRMVLDYVGGAMKESRLKKYLIKEETQPDGKAAMPFDEETDLGFYVEYTKRRASANKETRMPTMGDLIDRVQRHSETVFSQIAETFRKSILATYLMQLPQRCEGEDMDVRVIPDEMDTRLYRLVALCKDRQDHHQLHHVIVTLQQGTAKGFKHTTSSNLLSMPEVKRIIDAKFVDDKTFLVLAETRSDVRIYLHDVVPESEDIAWELRHVFEQGQMDGGLRPGRMDVNGRVGRRVVAVLDRDGLGQTVLDLDTDDGTGHTDRGGDSFMTG